MSRIAVLGAGAWGTALAVNLCRRADHRVTLWAHTPAPAAQLVQGGETRRYLPGCALPPALRMSDSLDDAITGAELVLLVVPSQHIREVAAAAQPLLRGDALMVSAAKAWTARPWSA